jgi:hypothetical protein
MQSCLEKAALFSLRTLCRTEQFKEPMVPGKLFFRQQITFKF